MLMPMRLISLLVLICLFAPGMAYALQCPNPPPPPRVMLDRIEDPVQYDFNRNRANLNAMGAKILAAQRAGSTSYVGGLTNGIIASNMSTQIQTLTSSDGMACMWISEINIKLHYQPTVYISREFVPGSCYHNAVMAHEQKHVGLDQALLAAFAPQLQQGIQAGAQSIGLRGPMPQGQMESVSRDLQNTMERRLNDLMDRFSTDREAHQMQIDTAQEYARVQSLCRNWP